MKKVLLVYTLMLTLLTCANGTYKRLSSYFTNRTIKSISIDSGLAFIGSSEYGLLILDINNPENPELVSRFNTLGIVNSIDVLDNLVYLSDTESIRILDITNTDNPIEISCLELESSCNYLKLCGSLAYLSLGHDGMCIIDVSDPANPIYITHYDFDCYLSTFDVVNNKVFAPLRQEDELRILDFSNPLEPVLLSSYYSENTAQAVEVSDNIAYLCTVDDGLLALDISDPSNPDSIGCYIPEVMLGFRDIEIHGDKALLDRGYNGVSILDISDPENMNEIGYYDMEIVSSIDWGSENDVALIGTQSGEVRLININDSENDALVGYINTSCARSLCVSQDKVYVANGFLGTEIVSILNPASPEVIGNCLDNGYSWEIIESDNLLYIADKYYGLMIWDVTNPSSPDQISNYNETSSAWSVTKRDDLIFIGDEITGFHVLDVTDPYTVSLLGIIYEGGESSDIAFMGNIAFLASGGSGLRVVELNNYDDYTLLSETSIEGGDCISLSLNGNILYVSSGIGGLQVFDVSDPLSPSIIQVIKPHDNSDIKAEVLLIDGLMLVSDEANNEILTYNVSEPDNPVLITSYRWNSRTEDMAVCGEVLLTANRGYGLSILDFESVTGIKEDFQLVQQPNNITLANHPNPFNPSTTIEFSLNESSMIDLSIFNIKGQLVKTLVSNENYSGGSHSVAWDGRDNSGNQVSSGIYFYSIKSDEFSLTKKMLMLK